MWFKIRIFQTLEKERKRGKKKKRERERDLVASLMIRYAPFGCISGRFKEVPVLVS